MQVKLLHLTECYILSVCLNIKHSYLGDLAMELSCLTDGCKVVLKGLVGLSTRMTLTQDHRNRKGILFHSYCNRVIARETGAKLLWYCPSVDAGDYKPAICQQLTIGLVIMLIYILSVKRRDDDLLRLNLIHL